MLGAFVAEASGDLPLAAERITRAVQLDPRNFLIRKTELRLLSGLSDPAPAVAACTRSIADFPDHSLFTEWMADHLAATGRPAEAIAAARRAVGISKGEARSRIVLARLLAASPDAKDHSESATLYADLLRESGETPGALRALAMTALVAGDDRWAIELLTRASTASPDAAILADLAYALIAAGRLDEARASLDRALTLDPRSAEVRRVFLLLADQTGDTALRAKIEQMPVR
jgi:Flp pilus assembly protein TadD